MDGETCDMCGKMLLADEDARYIVRIEVFAAYDPLELTADDIERDRSEEIRRLMQHLETQDPQELQDQVYRRFMFDLCPACQKSYLASPLGRREAGK